jgi:hypothetical protein
MKPSRSRSRSKNNRNRGGNNNNNSANVVNRVFDSSGPESKVRGTPQQIIDKYNQLARDSQVSGDRVATENFQQHAEHYLRMLSEAQREMDARREEQERQNRERQEEQDRLNRERQIERDRERQERVERQETVSNDPAEAPQPDVVDQQPAPARAPEPVVVQEEQSNLVETPESQPKPKPKPRARRKPKPKPEAAATDAPTASEPPAAPDAAE